MSNTETFTDYLDRVGADFNSSGFEATADDYFTTVSRINTASGALEELARELNSESLHEVAVRIQTIVDSLNRPLVE